MPASVLVIGYGNLLRRDDAFGPCVASQFGQKNPEVQLLLVPFLGPELAEPVSAVELAIFVDARVGDALSGIRTERLDLGASSSPWLGHLSDPRAILALASAVYGRVPRAYLVTAPLSDDGLGFGLSELAREWVPRAVEVLTRLIEKERAR